MTNQDGKAINAEHPVLDAGWRALSALPLNPSPEPRNREGA